MTGVDVAGPGYDSPGYDGPATDRPADPPGYDGPTATGSDGGWVDPGTGADGAALASAHAQGRRLAEDGDLTGARTMMEQALAVAEQRLGRDHPQLAPIMVDLATIARNVGNLTEAQNQLRRAYGIIVSSVGPEHATALSVEGRLAAVSNRLGEPTEAYDWHLADVGVRVLGPEHPAVRGARQRLAENPPMPDYPAYDSEGYPPHGHESYAGYEDGYADPAHLAPPGYAGHADGEPYEFRHVDSSDGGPYEDEEPGYAPTYAATYAPAYAAGAYPPPVEDEPLSPEEEGLYQPDRGPAAGYAPHPTAPGVYQRQPTPDEPRRSQAGSATAPATASRATASRTPAAPATPPHQRSHPYDVSLHPYPAYPQLRTRRAHAGGKALVASLGAVVLTAAAIVAFQFARANATQPGSPPASQPTTAGPEQTPTPTGQPRPAVQLLDRGGSVTLTWSDPGSGRVPFIVAGGRAGEGSAPFETVPAGRTSFTIYGLNERFDYCFTVAAVLSSDLVVASAPTCTKRLSTSPTTGLSTGSPA